MVSWHFYTWNDLNTELLYACLRLRQNVFIIEQNCPYPELDDKDKYAVHVLGIDNGTKQCVAYARIFPKGKYFEEASIGRVCTHIDWRKKGVGKELMKRVLEFMDAEYGMVPVEISAQSYLLDFYAGYGFVAKGDEYLEDDIPHHRMFRNHNK